MRKPEIYVDGVRYVPATEAAPSMDAITRGLLKQFWGECDDATLQRLKGEDYIHCYVNDNGQGPKLADVLADIAEAIGAASNEAG